MKNEQGYTVYKSEKGWNPESYKINDFPAKKEGLILLEQDGWSINSQIELYKKGDNYFKKVFNGVPKIRLFEFELRGLNWTENMFPYSTLHVPPRKLGIESIYDYYIQFNTDLDRAALMKGDNIRSSPRICIDTINHKTKEITKNEVHANVDCSLAWMFKKINGIWIQSSEKGRTWRPKEINQW